MQWATIAVFALTGVSLRLADVRAALNAKRAALYGLVSCLGLSALLAPAVLLLGPQLLPQLHAEFFAGLALLCCVPTTLSTGVILARQANANDALVLLIMLLTNVIGVATLPFALAEVFGASAGAALEPLVMLEGLAYTVLAPLLAGVFARIIPGVPWLVNKFRAYIRLAQQACLIATPWMTVRAVCCVTCTGLLAKFVLTCPPVAQTADQRVHLPAGVHRPRDDCVGRRCGVCAAPDTAGRQLRRGGDPGAGRPRPRLAPHAPRAAAGHQPEDAAGVGGGADAAGQHAG